MKMLGMVRTCNRNSVLVLYVQQNSGSYLRINLFIYLFAFILNLLNQAIHLVFIYVLVY